MGSALWCSVDDVDGTLHVSGTKENELIPDGSDMQPLRHIRMKARQ